MLTFKEVLRELGGDHSGQAQAIWTSLIRAAVQRAGGEIDDVRSADEARAADGGVDIEVPRGVTPSVGRRARGRAGNAKGAHYQIATIGVTQVDASRLLPKGRTVYSIKSGRYASDPGTLRSELNPRQHQALCKRLAKGWSYVYCAFADVSGDSLAALEAEAKRICRDRGYPRSRIRIYTHQHLLEGLTAFPAVLARFMPAMARLHGRGGDVWGQQSPAFDTNIEFVPFDQRSADIERVIKHLRDSSEPAVLHVCGLSGIGKTRLVYEAVRRAGLAKAVLYLARPGRARELLTYLAQEETSSALLVIDECAIDTYQEIVKCLKGMGSRVRVVTIGPKMDREATAENVIQLAEPQNAESVETVLLGTGSGLDSAAVAEVARDARHDIRLALLMMKVRGEAGPDIVPILHRVIGQFHPERQGASHFQEVYPFLTTMLTVGVAGPSRIELEWLAQQFDIAPTRLDEAVAVSCRCGLGERGVALYEPVPRGLATRLFEELVWPILRNRFVSFLQRAPNAGARDEVLRRIELTADGVRVEAAEYLSRMCFSLWPERDLKQVRLGDDGAARLFKRWLLLHSRHALMWFAQAIDRLGEGPSERYAALAAMGPPSVRWLSVLGAVRRLAVFPELYDDVESVLFQLALAGHASRDKDAVRRWASLHQVWGAGIAVSYPVRVSRLLERLHRATLDTIPVVMQGVLAAIAGRDGSEVHPQRVGGRIAPGPWVPSDRHHYFYQVDAIKASIKGFRALDESMHPFLIEYLIEHLPSFVRQHTIAEVRQFIEDAKIGEDRHRIVFETLQRSRRKYSKASSKDAAELNAGLDSWLEALRPRSLTDRLKRELCREPWDMHAEADGEERSAAPWRDTLQPLVKELLEAPAVLETLTDWFERPEVRSSVEFGVVLAEEDRDGRLHGVIEKWLVNRRCDGVVWGYLSGSSAQGGELPTWATAALDALIERDPTWVARLSIQADQTTRGLKRALACCAVPGVDVASACSRMFGDGWEAILTSSDQAHIVRMLVPEGFESSQERIKCAVHLLRMWMHHQETKPFEDPLQAEVLRLLASPIQSSRDLAEHEWLPLASTAAIRRPEEVIDIAIDAVCSDDHDRTDVARLALMFLATSAPKHGEVILRSLLPKWLAGGGMGNHFHREWKDLVSALPLATLKERIRAEGVELVKKIARVLPRPAVDAEGKPMLHPLTDWLLREYGLDDQVLTAFVSGTHFGEVVHGSANQRLAEFREVAAAFEDHDNPHLRRWIAREIGWLEDDVQRDRTEDNEPRREY